MIDFSIAMTSYMCVTNTLTRQKLCVLQTIKKLGHELVTFICCAVSVFKEVFILQQNVLCRKVLGIKVAFVLDLWKRRPVATEDQNLIVIQEINVLLDLRARSHRLQNFKNRSELNSMEPREELRFLNAKEIEKLRMKLSKFLCV